MAEKKENDLKAEIAEENYPPVSFCGMYKYAGGIDYILMFFGILCSVAYGCAMPMIAILFGDLIQAFEPSEDRTDDDMVEDVQAAAFKMLYLGIISFFLAMGIVVFWMNLGERIGVIYRRLYLESILKHDVSWFDLNKPQELPTKMATHCMSVTKAVGEKVGMVLMSLTMCVVGAIVGFAYGWKLCLCCIGLVPFIMMAGALMTITMEKTETMNKKAYQKSGGYAQEALSAIRTVLSFCAQQLELDKYLSGLNQAQQAAVKNALFMGFGVAFFGFFMDVVFTSGLYIGSYFIEYEVKNDFQGEDYEAGHVMTVFFAMMFGFMSLGLCVPHIKAITEGKASAAVIQHTILEGGQVPEHSGTVKIPDSDFHGNITFEAVNFEYPSAPGFRVLDDLSFTFEAGKATAICGETGSGKSTIIQLIEGFYTPKFGKVIVDGVELTDIDIDWFRKNIGYVGQEPVLFNTTIRQNLLYGNSEATDMEIEKACKRANCWDFIDAFEDKLMTLVGAEGSQLSGGQKQRIAIARAIIKNPKILLLDEATSALDRKSEKVVQEAINKISKEITTIIVAHRLSTIKDANCILVLHQGSVSEFGTHDYLSHSKGIYAALYEKQMEKQIQEDIDDEDLDRQGLNGIHSNNMDRENDKESDPRDVVIDVPRKKSSEYGVSLKSAIKEEELEQEKEEEVEKKSNFYFSRIWNENKDYKCSILVAMILSTISGLRFPIIGMYYGAMNWDLLLPDKDELREEVNKDYIILICTSGIASVLQFFAIFLMGKMGTKITYCLRQRLYKKITEMHVGWHDQPKNNATNLSSVLFEDTKRFNDVFDIIINTTIGICVGCVAAIIISFVLSWRMALIVLGTFPFMVIAGAFETEFLTGYQAKTAIHYKNSVAILSESVRNFRTVVSFCTQNAILKLYNEYLLIPIQKMKSAAFVSGLMYGFSQFVQFVIYGLTFYFGALIMKHYDVDGRNMMMVFNCLMLTAYYMGQVQQYAPDMGKAQAALHHIYRLIDTPTKIDANKGGVEVGKIRGKIEFKNVFFKYPTRKEWVLKNFSITVEEGQKVALVGVSGSGKSTVIQLLERFYDVRSGEILVDGVDIRDYNLNQYRKLVGLVAQEPKVFDTTIMENLL